MKTMESADGLLRLRPAVPIRSLLHDRSRKKLLQALAYANRTRPGSAASVRGREGLVQIEVHDVYVHIAWADHAEDCVEIGAVVVDQPTSLVDNVDCLSNVFVPQAERIGIGD